MFSSILQFPLYRVFRKNVSTYKYAYESSKFDHKPLISHKPLNVDGDVEKSRKLHIIWVKINYIYSMFN